jgi:hypothetical protein
MRESRLRRKPFLCVTPHSDDLELSYSVTCRLTDFSTTQCLR